MKLLMDALPVAMEYTSGWTTKTPRSDLARWEPKEVERLESGMIAGRSVPEIAVTLNRTHQNVRAKINLLIPLAKPLMFGMTIHDVLMLQRYVTQEVGPAFLPISRIKRILDQPQEFVEAYDSILRVPQFANHFPLGRDYELVSKYLTQQPLAENVLIEASEYFNMPITVLVLRLRIYGYDIPWAAPGRAI